MEFTDNIPTSENMQFIDKINNLLILLNDIEKYEIHDYYIFTLIHDIIHQIDPDNYIADKKINIEFFEKYIKYIEKNISYIPNGFKPKNLNEEKTFSELYIGELSAIKIMFLCINENFDMNQNLNNTQNDN